MNAKAELRVWQKRLDDRANDPSVQQAKAYLERDGQSIGFGLSASKEVIEEFEQLAREIEPLLSALGEKIDDRGSTADGRIMEWAFRQLHPRVYSEGTELLENPFRQLAAALVLMLGAEPGANSADKKEISCGQVVLPTDTRVVELINAVTVEEKKPKKDRRPITELATNIAKSSLDKGATAKAIKTEADRLQRERRRYLTKCKTPT